MTTHNKNSSHKSGGGHRLQKSGSANHTQKSGSQHSSSARATKSAPAAAATASGFNTQTLIVFALVIAAFFGAYRFARASNSSASPVSGGITNASAQTGGIGGSGGGGGGGGGCCGGGGPAVTGAAQLEGGVQKISVDLSSGSYNPNTIQLKAGVPTEITFGQSNGCTAIVQSRQLGFQENLSSGPKTVKLAALQPGTYGFACGMNMVQGQIVVQ